MNLYTVLGIFADRPFAENALTQLEEAGYNPKDMSIVMKDQATAQHIASNSGANVTGGALSGAATGAVVGGLAGLLVGMGAIAIPGLGAFLIGGPIAVALGLSGAAATTISGATTGAIAGGILGALMGLGLPEQDARVYEQHINEGGILLAVPAVEEEIAEVKDVLHQCHATQIRSFIMEPAMAARHSIEPTDEEFEEIEPDDSTLTAAQIIEEEDTYDDEIDREYVPRPSIHSAVSGQVNSGSRPAYAYVGTKGGSTRNRLRRDLFDTQPKERVVTRTTEEPLEDRPIKRLRRDRRY